MQQPLQLLLALVCMVVISNAYAVGDLQGTPAFPDYYKETVRDITVKVVGGYTGMVRTWYRGRWHFSRAFEPLEITRDPSSGKVQEISSNGSRYTRADTSGRIFTFGTRQRIRVTDQGFRFEDLDGNWVEYDAQGVATVYGDHNNVQVSFGYDSQKRRNAVFDHHGNQVLWYTYDATGNLTSIRDYASREVTYEYNASGQMVAVVDISGNRWQYRYTGTGDATRLVTVQDPVGKITTITYTNTGMVRSVLDQEGIGASYRYLNDKARRQLNIERYLTGGRVDSIWYNSRSEIERHDINDVTVFTVQSGGREKAIIDRNGGKTVDRYDEFNNLVSRVYPDGSAISFTYKTITVATGSTAALQKPMSMMLLSQYTNENGVTTRFDYDAAGNLVRRTDAAGSVDERVTEFEPDQYGQSVLVRTVADVNTREGVTTLSYDNFGNVIRLVEPEGAVNEYTWSSAGELLTHLDGRNKLWVYSQDAAGRITGLTDPLGNSLSFTYTPLGQFASYTDQENNVWVFGYNIRGNLVTVTDPADGVQSLRYNAQGQLIEYKDQLGRKELFSYDAAGRLTGFTDGAGNRLSREFDDSGSVGSGQFTQPSQIQLPTYVKRMVYDNRNRVISEVSDLGGGQLLGTLYRYDPAGNLISETNPSGAQFQAQFTRRNLPTTLQSALGDRIHFIYDDMDNIVEFIDANGNSTRYDFDRNSRRISDERPMGETRNYTYDVAGNLLVMHDAKGQRVEFSYDDANRMIEERHYATTQASVPEKTISYSYDGRSLLTRWDDGQLSGSFVYDHNRRITRGEINYGSFSKVYQYGYSANGRMDTYTAPDGVVYQFTYDSANRPVAVSIPGEGLVSINDFQWVKPTEITFPGGGRQQVDYTALLESARIVRKDPAKNALSDRNYTYDNNRDVVTSADGGDSSSFAYDANRQLTRASGSSSGDYVFAYDGAGNRDTVPGSTRTWVRNENNELLSQGGVTYSYDANGNRTRREEGAAVQNYRYDVRNRLIEVTDNAGTVLARYGYDPFGRRLWKEAGGVRTYYLYTSSGLMAEFASDGSPQRSYGYWPDSQWSSNPLFIRTAGKYYYYNNDRLGVPREIVDKTGRVVWSADYRPFGSAIVSASATLSNSLRLPGQYFDQETGLHYNYFRYYDPEIGAYLQTDPVELIGGPNPYTYAGNNPLNITDETGLCPLCAVAIREAGRIGMAAGAVGLGKLIGDVAAGKDVLSGDYWKDNWKDYGKDMGRAVACLYARTACGLNDKYNKAKGAIAGTLGLLGNLSNPCSSYDDLFGDMARNRLGDFLKGKVPSFRPFRTKGGGAPDTGREFADNLADAVWNGVSGRAIEGGIRYAF